jgi:hypothetical protein
MRAVFTVRSEWIAPDGSWMGSHRQVAMNNCAYPVAVVPDSMPVRHCWIGWTTLFAGCAN